MRCSDLIVSQETGFLDAIVRKDLHSVMLLICLVLGLGVLNIILREP